MMKSEQKRLDRSTKTGVISNKSQAIPPELCPKVGDGLIRRRFEVA